MTSIDKRALLDQYEATGDDEAFLAAKRLYEEALADGDDPTLLLDYGYLLECHGRHSIRHAVTRYERAIELEPTWDKPHYQLIAARAALLETDRATASYRERLATSPRDVREHRFLAGALLAARAYEEARSVVEAGLRLAPSDPALIERPGDLRAGTGDPDGALRDWRQALDLDPENLSGLYSSAFLLEREGRLAEAIQAWRSIIEWSAARGFTLDTDWPNREIERLRGTLEER
jgi:tetratricopeptide (TPR) repeat protein